MHNTSIPNFLYLQCTDCLKLTLNVKMLLDNSIVEALAYNNTYCLAVLCISDFPASINIII